MKTIVIDAGHGGYDYGAVNGARYEKNDNLTIARLVAAELRRQGQHVIMTRDTDEYVPLLERSAISNRNNADMFVSLHRNAFTDPAANGMENYVQVNSPQSTRDYAQNVVDEINAAGGFADRGVKINNFSVLRNTRAPAMLLELGFISNAADNQAFDRNANAYASAITKGILKSLGETYNPNGGSGGGSDERRATATAIQRGLNNTYNAGLTVDGIYGPRTRTALVRALQIELNETGNAGLTVDGIFGQRTKSAIPALRRGARSNLVYILQALLFFKGYNLSVDGVYGPATEGIVREFQRDRGLTADGVAGANTFEALFK
ncbi:MAG: N-acetylmuramoyl-L-alanine amidase [Clostridiales bacterium]|jgi:N-acetylmuramoyl-L-alanine amidase|nr:N-acetylmuramoyl-L-alanine amidase [Clostridiales bacterium]